MAEQEHELVGFANTSAGWWEFEPPEDRDIGTFNAVLVHAWDPEDKEEERYFWVHHPGEWQDWEDVETWVDFAIEEGGS